MGGWDGVLGGDYLAFSTAGLKLVLLLRENANRARAGVVRVFVYSSAARGGPLMVSSLWCISTGGAEAVCRRVFCAAAVFMPCVVSSFLPPKMFQLLTDPPSSMVFQLEAPALFKMPPSARSFVATLRLF